MATATKTTSLVAELDQRREAVQAARRRVQELEAEKAGDQHSIERAAAPLEDYYHQVETGERKPDSSVEKRLQAALNEAEASATTRITYNQRAESGSAVKVELVNPKLDGLLRGARDTLQRCEQEYDYFLRSRFEGLCTELAGEAKEVTTRHAEAWQKAQEAERDWRAVRERWRPLISTGAFEVADFPTSPLDGIAEIPMPLPRQLTSDEHMEMPRPAGPRPKTRKRAG